MRTLLSLLIIVLLSGCEGSTYKCDQIYGKAYDGSQLSSYANRIDHENSILEIERLKWERRVLTGIAEQITADTVLINLKTTIEIGRIRTQTTARLCGCE